MADYLASLLYINMGTTGACFALDDDVFEGDSRTWVLLVSRISAQQLDKEEIETALGSLFRMSSIYDE